MENKKVNELPERFTTWFEFYKHSLRPSLDKYPGSEFYSYTVDGVTYDGTIDFVKARCYEEIMNDLFEVIHGRGEGSYEPYGYDQARAVERIVGPIDDYLTYHQKHGVEKRPEKIRA